MAEKVKPLESELFKTKEIFSFNKDKALAIIWPKTEEEQQFVY